MAATDLSSNPNPQGVHFVGSVPLPTTRDVFELLGTTMASHIRRIPDGEPSARKNFIQFQRELFLPHPQLVNTRYNPTATSGQPLPDVDAVTRHLERLETGYDAAAIESYATFAEMRGRWPSIPRGPGGVKFQVGVPTPLNVLTAMVAPNYQALVEPHYAAALVRALERIQAEIPHHDLAIQIDCAHEFAVLEETWARQPGMERSKPWWCDVDGDGDNDADVREAVFRGVVDRVVALAGAGHIAPDVELGLHFCYGDFGHKHFIEPTDTGTMVRAALAILPRLGRRVDYIHMPVPKERDDEAYFAPLRALLPLLRAHSTVLYLGLVREGDEAGTIRRIETARKVIDGDGDDGGSASGSPVTWGIATECGMGRMQSQDVPWTLDVMKKLARPIR